MIESFVKAWNERKEEVRATFAAKHPESYKDVVKAVVGILGNTERYSAPDPERIHEINDGDYQGTLVYVIGAEGYQPSKYWYIRVYYGSCGGCDTLEAIKDYDYSGGPPTDNQVDQYMTLALHIIQRLKPMEDETV